MTRLDKGFTACMGFTAGHAHIGEVSILKAGYLTARDQGQAGEKKVRL